MDSILTIIIPIYLLFSIIGTVCYRKLVTNWYGIIGVGGAYFVFLGILLCIPVFYNIFQGRFDGNVIAFLVFIAIGLIVLIRAMLKCSTTAQRIKLPFVCALIAMGFAFRLVFKIFLNMPMSPMVSDDDFPGIFRGNDGQEYKLVSVDAGGNRAIYECNGKTISIDRSNLSHHVNHVYD